MAENSKISWTDHTYNPWIGCTKVSEGCRFCYAETWSMRTNLVKWNGDPKRTSARTQAKPLRWDSDANKAGKPARVFCASLADWLDPRAHPEWLVGLLQTIDNTPNLVWQLLTKRPQLFKERMAQAHRHAIDNNNPGVEELLSNWDAGIAPANVWLGTSVENQERADERIPELTAIPAMLRFLSCEPLLGPVDLGFNAPEYRMRPDHEKIHWVICGGETGSYRREMDPEWAIAMRHQCHQNNVPFYFKQFSAPRPSAEPPKLDGFVRAETPMWRGL